MPYFPMLCNIEEKHVLIVGGGKTARKKLKALQPFCRHITILAEETDLCDEEIRRMQQAWQDAEKGAANIIAKNEINVIRKPFELSDLEGYGIVVGATDDSGLNALLSVECKKRGILVNIVDDKDKSDFIFPAMYSRKDLLIAVSTSGKSPLAAAKIRDVAKAALPEHVDEIIDRLSQYRMELMETGLPAGQRKQLLENYYEKLQAH